ncbi:MAG: hypothetical protein Q4D43_06780, partial [Clostridia bacterium]|nr:hypothetical protein [Clostridia bacterium]
RLHVHDFRQSRIEKECRRQQNAHASEKKLPAFHPCRSPSQAGKDDPRAPMPEYAPFPTAIGTPCKKRAAFFSSKKTTSFNAYPNRLRACAQSNARTVIILSRK